MSAAEPPVALSVVVPVFRGAAQVPSAVERLVAGLEGHVPDFEIVLVDDGSGDGTSDALRAAAASDPRVRSVHLPANRGKGAAVAAGMAAARGRVRAFTDVDVPYGTAPIVEMHARIAAGGADAAIGDRQLPGSSIHDHVPLVRRVASFAFARLVRLLAPTDTLDTQCGVKAFDGEVAARLFPLVREPGFAFDAEALFLCRRFGLRVVRLAVRLERTGPSTVSVGRVAVPMLRSVARLRGRWRRGEYADAWLSARGAARRGAPS